MSDRYTDTCEEHGEMAGWLNAHPYCIPCDNLEEPSRMTNLEVREARKSLGLNQEQFAAMLRCSRSTVAMWELNGVGGPAELAIDLILGLTSLQKKITIEAPVALKPAE